MPLPPNVAKMSHNGRELKLMLAGRKPLAMFYAEVAALPDEELIPERAFAKYVERGRISRGEETYRFPTESPRRKTRVRYVFFAMHDEEWRIPAMKLVIACSLRMRGWNEGIERVEGALLGYTPKEADIWWKHIRRRTGAI
jgi:hypothetical protein